MLLSSTQSFLQIPAVAEAAGVSGQTLRNWIAAGLVVPTRDVEGRPVFTPFECDAIVALAKSRRYATELISLPQG